MLLLVLSDRRSGSTFLSETLARALPCSVELGEPLLAPANAGGYLRHAWAGHVDAALAKARVRNPLPWLQHVRELACAHRGAACAEKRCVAVIKLLRRHKVPPTRLYEMLRAPDVRSVLLERPVRETDCSLRWALHTQDWATTPSERKRSNRSAAYAQHVHACLQAEPTPEYARAHASWFATARAMGVTLDESFWNATRHTGEVVARIAHQVGLWPTVAVARDAKKDDAPVERPSLALVTMVTRSDAYLDEWAGYHLHRLGAREVFVYWKREEAPRRSNASVRHYTIAEAAAESHGRIWWWVWPNPKYGCQPVWRPTRPIEGVDEMCEKRMFMPEQAQTARHAAARAQASWMLTLDLDEYLVGEWRAFLAMMQARPKPPGGVRLDQLQMVDAHTCLEPRRKSLKNEQKPLIRRAALHSDARTYGSVHEPTLKRGEIYVTAAVHVLAIAHWRYRNWNADGKRARLKDLNCVAGSATSNAEHGALCAAKRREVQTWELELHDRRHVTVDAQGLPPERPE